MKRARNTIRNTIIGIVLFILLGLVVSYNRLDLILNPPTTELPEYNSILLNIDKEESVPFTTFRFRDNKNKYEIAIWALLDTGSAINTIDEESYQLIKELGYVKKEYFCPLVVTDANRHTRIHTLCIHIDIPVQLTPELYHNHCIKDIRFFVVPGKEGMTLGVELLKEFIIHSEAYGEQWRLSKELPENYLVKFKLKNFNWHIHDLGGRYYWPLTIDGVVQDNFFIDTGYGFSALQLPIDNYKGNNIAQTTVSQAANSKVSIEHTYDTLTVKVGDIIFDAEACFFNGTVNTQYVINPYALSNKFDISYDLKNKMLYIVRCR